MTTIQTNTVDPSLLASMNGGTNATTSAQAAQDRFMKLLVTQMKNQDPLNPMDNAQVTSQLAQLSTVTGIDKLNASVTAMSANFQTSQNLQAANMIGHSVVTAGNALSLANGKGIYGVDLPQGADSAKVTISDANGLVVRQMSVGSMQAGTNMLAWDGKTDSGASAADGVYKFQISANAGGEALKVTPLSFGLVSSISTGTQGTKLSVANVGEISMAEVKTIY